MSQTNNPLVQAIVPFIAREASNDWVRDQWILRATLRSLLSIEEKFLSITLVVHQTPSFVQNVKRVRILPVEYDPPNKNDQDAKLGDSAVKYMQGVRDAFSRRVPWVFFVNADHLISKDLPRIANLSDYEAVVFKRGFSWKTGSRWLMRLSNFHRRCGSCNLVRCEEKKFPVWLGGRKDKRLGDANHNEVLDAMLQSGFRVQVPSRRLAVYRLGTHNNYWRPERHFMGKIRARINLLLRARPISKKLIEEFSIPLNENPKPMAPLKLD